jgi:hypothetical protein
MSMVYVVGCGLTEGRKEEWVWYVSIMVWYNTIPPNKVPLYLLQKRARQNKLFWRATL